jgi:hypothetical protein
MFLVFMGNLQWICPAMLRDPSVDAASERMGWPEVLRGAASPK